MNSTESGKIELPDLHFQIYWECMCISHSNIFGTLNMTMQNKMMFQRYKEDILLKTCQYTILKKFQKQKQKLCRILKYSCFRQFHSRSDAWGTNSTLVYFKTHSLNSEESLKYLISYPNHYFQLQWHLASTETQSYIHPHIWSSRE